jgi:tetratricopeptide (TPR) repeat protein
MRKVSIKKHFLLLALAAGIALATSCGSYIRSSFSLAGAESYYKNGDYERSIEYYDKVIALNENLDEAYNGKAKCLEALGEYEECLEFCDKALEQNSNMADAYNTKGDALSSLNRFEESLESFKKAFELEPNESLYANKQAYAFNCLEKFEDSLEYSEKAIKLNKNNDSAYINKGYALDALGKTNEALDCYNKAAEINPSNPTCFYNKGTLLEAIGRSDEAIDCFDKALALDPNDLDALNSKGDSLNSLSEFEKAIDCFEQVLDKDPKNAYASVSKSVSLYCQGKYSEAIEICDKVLEIEPEYFSAYIWKAKNLMEIDDDLENARKLCDKSISIVKSPFAYNTKGLSYVYEYDYPKAIDCFEQAIEVDPSYVDAYTNKIYCLYYQKNYSKCIEFSNQALDLFQDNQDIPWYIGDCYSALLDSDKAIEYYKKALEIDSKTTSLIVSIAWEYYSLQDYDKAREYLNKAKDISPNDEGVLYLESQLKKQELPEAERIVDFVKENYLYIDKVNNFEKLAEQFKAKKEVNINDISQFIDSTRLRDDMFTFFIHGDEYDLIKQEENISQVESKVLESNIHYIKIKSFTESVSWEFKEIIDGIENPEDNVLVIDLRDNTGGVTSSSTDILNYLLPECTTSYIVYRNGSMHPYYSDKSFIKFKKILVLVNEYSASSSEILALGLKKYLNNVVIIGHSTVGKGVGQLVYEDKAKKYMIYLVSFYWNVMEENIMEKRITPDVYVKGSDDSSYIKEIKRQAF